MTEDGNSTALIEEERQALWEKNKDPPN